MSIAEVMPTLCGKQSDEHPDTSLLSYLPSDPPVLASRKLFLASSDVRFGSIPLKNSLEVTA